MVCHQVPFLNAVVSVLGQFVEHLAQMPPQPTV